MNQEVLKRNYVSTLNTLMPDLKPWIESRILRGQSTYQTLMELRTLLGGHVSPIDAAVAALPFETLAGVPHEALLSELHARLDARLGRPTSEYDAIDLTDKAP